MGRRKDPNLGNHKFGEAAVKQVEAELLFQGYDVYLPSVDDHGVDLAVIKGNTVVRLQVKSSTLRQYARVPAPSYGFTLVSTYKTVGGEVKRTIRPIGSQCDFVVLYGLDDNLYWIVPSGWLDKVKALTISSSPKSKDVNWDEIFHEYSQGSTFRALSQKYGPSAAAICNRVNSKLKNEDGTLIHRIRKCENRWDLIAKFFESLPTQPPQEESLQVIEKKGLNVP